MEKVSITVELKEKISSELKKMVSGFAKVADTVYDLHKHLKKTNEEVENLNSISSKLNMPNLNAILDVADKITEVFVNASESGMAFEQSIADLQSITGIAGKDLESLTENCRRLGVESGLGAAEAARSYSLLASQIEISKIGMDGLNSLQEKAITLAQASGMSMEASANALAGTINQFGLSAEEADRVINVLAAGSKYGAAEIEDLSQSFKVVGAAASAMGLTVESTAGALEILSQANLKGSEAGTALRNIILKLNTELGIDLGETSLSKALEDLKPKLSDAAYLSKVFGMENIAAAQFLIQNAEAVDEMTAQLTDTNVAHEQAAIRTETNAHKLAQMRAQVEDLKIGMADFLGGMAPLLTVLSENAVALLTFGKAIQLAGKSSLVAAIHEKVQTLALKLLTSSSWFATAGMGALTAATIALYAALTLGISLVVTGIVAAFSALGDEGEDAANSVDVLKESNDAFKNTVSQTAADLEMEKAALKELIKENKDATDKVSALNAKYGDALGCHKTAAEWYDTLVAKSKTYCQQLGYEAQAKVLASQIAAKELELENAKNTQKQLEESGSHQKDSYVVNGLDPMTGGLRFNRIKVETSEYTDAKNTVASLNGELTKLRATWDTCINKMAEAGKALAETTNESNATSEALNWQAMSYADLKNAIEAQEKVVAKYAGTDPKRAAKESALLDKMKNRYKQLGKVYGLDNSGGENDRYSGKRLIENAKSYKELGNNIAYYQKKLEETDPAEEETIKTLAEKIDTLQKAQDEIKRMQEIAGLPAEVTTLEDINEMLSYLQGKRKQASAEELAQIDAEIKAYEEKQRAMEQGASDVRWEKFDINGIETYDELDEALSYYEAKVKHTQGTARAEAQKTVNSLLKLRDTWDAELGSLKMPEGIEKLNTFSDLGNAINYYEQKLTKANATEVAGIQRTIDELRRKEEALKRLTTLPAMERELTELGNMSGKQLKMELELIGLDGIKGKIRELQKMLDDTENPLNDDERKVVSGLVEEWQGYELQLRKSQVKMTDAWGNIKGIGNGIIGLTDTLKGNGTAWEKIVGVVDGVIGLYQSFSGIVGIINLLTQATQGQAIAEGVKATATLASAGAETTATTVEATASGITTAAIMAETSAWSALAAAKTFAAHAYIPFAGTGIAAGFIATQQGIIQAAALPKFANGGIAYGPTLGLFGEYAGAKSNPEIVAPLDRLRGLMGLNEPTSGGGGEVKFRIEGRTLVGLMDKMTRYDKRT